MASYYPLNGIDLDFGRYDHRPLGARDIIVHRIMQEYMSPNRLRAGVYQMIFNRDSPFAQIKARDRELGLDMYVLSRLLKTEHDWSFTQDELVGLLVGLYMISTTVETAVSLEEVILGLIERHYLESNPSVRIWLKHYHLFCSLTIPKHAPGRNKHMKERLEGFKTVPETHYRHFLFSGGHYLPINSSSDVQYSIDPFFIAPPLSTMLSFPLTIHPIRRFRAAGKPPPKGRLREVSSIYRGKPQRASSMPAPDSWTTAAIEGLDKLDSKERWIIYFPRRPLSKLDKLSRRRSESRTHIRAMFSDKPKWIPKEPAKKKAPGNIKHPCANCAQYTHLTKNCSYYCGYCDAPSHTASACPVKATNRCKCRPFPQTHTAFDCYIRCSRRCGHPQPPGHFKHKNAMLCSHRCCMCGAKGHSGRKCSLKKCPCGEQHLTQDCRWKVECPAKGCSFYHCHLHCRECGKKKDRGSKDKFVGRTCQDCLRNGKPVVHDPARN